MITQEEALDLINNHVTFSPTFKLWAGIGFGDFMRGDSITLGVEYDAFETDYLPARVKPVKIELDATFEINSEWSKEEFLRAVLNTALIIQQHEAREMFKVDGRGVFNPHRDDGIAAWDSTAKVHQTQDTSSVPREQVEYTH
jgi:hypothetical protein